MAKKRCSIVKATAQYAVYNTRDHYCILGRVPASPAVACWSEDSVKAKSSEGSLHQKSINAHRALTQVPAFMAQKRFWATGPLASFAPPNPARQVTSSFA